MGSIVIGVAGGSGSGKSTFTNRIKDYFGDDVVVLYHDNYYRRQDGVPFEQRVTVNYDHPDSLETELLVEHLKQLKEGNVTIGEKAVKSSYQLSEEEEITVLIPDNKEPDIEPENIPLSILYEDDQLLVVDKPKGMVVHPSAGHYSGTLVNALLYHCKGNLSGINGVLRPGIVHRIDKDTTGALLVCKTDLAHRDLAQQLKEHSITRRYRAIVHGNLKEEVAFTPYIILAFIIFSTIKGGFK